MSEAGYLDACAGPRPACFDRSPHGDARSGATVSRRLSDSRWTHAPSQSCHHLEFVRSPSPHRDVRREEQMGVSLQNAPRLRRLRALHARVTGPARELVAIGLMLLAVLPIVGVFIAVRPQGNFYESE